MSECLGCNRIAQAGDSKITEFANSVLYLGDHQYFKGYCVLWHKSHVREQHQLSSPELATFMSELSRCSQAIATEFGALKINLVSLGNQVEHLHWHIFPRYADDPDHLEHPWLHAADFSKAVPTDFDRDALIKRLQRILP